MRKLGICLFTGLVIIELAAAADVTGNWEVDVAFDDKTIAGGGIDCAFKQDGEKLKGSCAAGAAPLTGEVKGLNITWQMKAGVTEQTITYTGTVNETGTSMKGRFKMSDKGGSFTAVKQ